MFLSLVTPVIYNISNPVSLLITNTLNFYCIATGYPLVNISWRKNNINISSDTPNITMTTVPLSDSQTQYPVDNSIPYISVLGSIGILNFSSIARNDTANYSCIADNYLPTTGSLYDVSQSTVLTVLGTVAVLLNPVNVSLFLL